MVNERDSTFCCEMDYWRAVVERSLPTPETRSLCPVIGGIFKY